METVRPMSRQEHLDAVAEIAYGRGKVDGLREAWEKMGSKCMFQAYEMCHFSVYGTEPVNPCTYATCPLLKELP